MCVVSECPAAVGTLALLHQETADQADRETQNGQDDAADCEVLTDVADLKQQQQCLKTSLWWCHYMHRALSSQVGRLLYS